MAMIVYRLGALGVLFSAGVFFEAPLAGALGRGPSAWAGLAVLFGFAPLAGLVLLGVRPGDLARGSRTLAFFTHGAALLSVLWLVLWCFDWLALMMAMGPKAAMYIEHTSFLHLFGVGFAMAGYAAAWMAPRGGERQVRFCMTVGWAVSYMAWFNLFLQPALRWLWAPAVGGLLVAGSGFWLGRKMKNL